MFFIWIGLFLLTLGAIGLAVIAPRMGQKIAAGILALVLAISFVLSLGLYTQSDNEAKIIRGMSGSISKVDVNSGWGYASLGSSEIDYDLINQQVIFSQTAERKDGPHITATDREGVAADYDVTVTYSIDANEKNLRYIYKEYQTQDNLEQKLVNDNIRSVVRQIPGKYSTLEILSNRGKVETEISDALKERVKGSGITIDRVTLQEVLYPEEVMKRFQDAQNAKTGVETAKTEAERKRIEAEGQAQANQVLEESLTDDVLAQKKIDAMVEMAKHGSVFVVPDGSSPLVQVQPKG